MLDRITKFLGYDAVTSTGRRRATSTRIKSEDLVLNDKNRIRLVSTTQDIQRNFAIAAWAIRKHLDYVASFSFKSGTGDAGFDSELESYITWWSDRNNCDVRRRHPFRRIIRLSEARRIVDGDFFLLKLAGEFTRGSLQAIEGDRVATPQSGLPSGFNPESWTNGVKVSAGGAAKEYCINKRTDYGNLEFERIVPAEAMFVHGCFDRFDQIRGISPVASALNALQDCAEGFSHALAKLKVAQLFGLVFYRDAEAAFQTTSATIDSDSDGVADSGYEVDFGSGPVQLDLNAGDRAEFLESKSPPSETVDFLKLMVQVSLKALDIPYSFFDEAHTNFYGSRGGLMQYIKSCKHKIADLQDLLDDITRWRLGMAIFDGDLALPRGLEFQDVKWEWVPDGVPWWDPSKEVRGNTMAIAAGLDNPQRVCREIGTDFYENIDAIADAMAYAKSKGVPLNLATTGTTPVEAPEDEDSEEEEPEQDSEDE